MSEATLPDHASAIVIGGGVMGCSTLYHLKKQGFGDAILLERNKLTSGTTWHSAAQVRALRSSRNLTRLIQYSIELYSELEQETGQATGWINKGSLSIATNPERLIHIRRQEALAHSFGVRADFISGKEAGEIWPLMNSDDILGAVWSPDDGRVNPSDLCAALAKGARALGAKIFEDTPVTGIQVKDGRVVAVETDRGTIRCNIIALCTGLWSRAGAAMAGVAAPVWPCEHFYLLTKPVAGAENHLPSLSDHDAHLYIRDESQGLLVGCFEPQGKPLDPASLGEDFAFQLLPEDWDHFEPMMLNALHRLPVLETAEVRMLLNGPESFTTDGTFLLGAAAETRGFYLGCGMNSVGVATGGGAGMALAHIMIEGHPPFDLHEADPKRFHPSESAVEALAARAPEVLGKHYEIAHPGRQFVSARGLRQTPLHARWVAEKARFGQVYAWERPLYFDCEAEPLGTFGRPAWFEQVGREVAWAHQEAAIFDLSTYGKIRIEGHDADTYLDRLCANDMTRAPGRAIYTALLNDRGGFESDVTALRLSEDLYRLTVGTTAVARDLAWMRGYQQSYERVIITDETEAYATLALMGPRAPAIAAALGGNALLELGYFRHGAAQLAGVEVQAARLSYVGEAGWELTCRTEDVVPLYDALTKAGARPAGLYAQTAMRIEKRFLSMGHDLDGDVTPLEAGLDFAVDWDGLFIGCDALREQREAGPKVAMATILFEDETAVPLGSEPVYLNGAIIGQTTSAAFGYRIGRPLALAYLQRQTAIEDQKVEVDVAGRRYPGKVTLKPAFDPEGKRMRGQLRS